jgi:hypothetical protein
MPAPLQARSVRAQERDGAVAVSNRVEPAFVDGPVMTPAQQNEVLEAGDTAVDPVLHVMGIAAARRAAREPATPVASLERPPD